MKQQGTTSTRTERRAQLSALLFLCLTVHALFVSLTHHHRSAPLSARAVVAASDSDSPSSRDEGRDAGCQSCSLQRNFVADPHTAGYAVEQIVAVPAREALRAAPLSKPCVSPSSGRAPPLV